jgi:hypothetical protein
MTPEEIQQHPRIKKAIIHLRQQTDKLGLYRALLEILTDDIDLRRQIEKIENENIVQLPPERRASVRVEQTREQIQATANEISQQLNHLVELLIEIVVELSGKK